MNDQTPFDKHLQVLAGQNVPFSQEAEEAVLGAILVHPAKYIEIAAFLRADDFYFLRHAYIWRAFERIVKRNDPIDYLTVVQEISDMGWLDEIGGAPFITHLVTNTPTSIHANVYGHLVERDAIRRDLLVAADDIRIHALNTEDAIEDVIGKSQRRFLQVMGRVVESRGEFMGPGMKKLLDEIEALKDDGSLLIGVPSGLIDLDDLMGGFEKQDLIILAGRPGMGKSALVGCIALNAAKSGYKVGVFPNEMTTDELKRRMLSVESGINTRTIKRGALNTPDWNKVYESGARIHDLPIYIDDMRSTPRQIQAKCEWLKRTWGLDLVLIDGLYRMPSDTGSRERYDRYSELAEDLKSMTRDLDLPVIVTHQLSRACEQRQDKRPMLSDLAESGRIEQEADVILFIYRDAVYNDNTELPNTAEIIIGKNRDGETGVISCYFDRSLTRFMNGVKHQVSLRERLQGNDH